MVAVASVSRPASVRRVVSAIAAACAYSSKSFLSFMRSRRCFQRHYVTIHVQVFNTKTLQRRPENTLFDYSSSRKAYSSSSESENGRDSLHAYGHVPCDTGVRRMLLLVTLL